MKKWLVGYWKYQHDQWEDIEKKIEAIDFDKAYIHFRRFAPNVKIRYIQEIN
jgi:hypothetical protein